MKNTNEPIVDIRPGRAVGNTTRQVDKAIDWLFQGETVLIIDHHGSLDSNRRLLHLILDRLKREHNFKNIINIVQSKDITIKLQLHG